jgi:hypothetical protein
MGLSRSTLALRGSRVFFKTRIIMVADEIQMKKTTLEPSGTGGSETAE